MAYTSSTNIISQLPLGLLIGLNARLVKRVFIQPEQCGSGRRVNGWLKPKDTLNQHNNTLEWNPSKELKIIYWSFILIISL